MQTVPPDALSFEDYDQREDEVIDQSGVVLNKHGLEKSNIIMNIMKTTLTRIDSQGSTDNPERFGMVQDSLFCPCSLPFLPIHSAILCSIFQKITFFRILRNSPNIETTDEAYCRKR